MKAILSARQTGLLTSGFLILTCAPLLFVRPLMERDASRERLFCGSLPFCAPEGPAERGFQFLRNGSAEGGQPAIEQLKIALERDSASPYRWCDLGEAYLASGDLAMARKCYARGLELATDSPVIQLRMAHFLLRDGQPREAVMLMARRLMQFEFYDDAIFSYYDRLALPIAEVLEFGLPVDQRAAAAWFQHLRQTGRLDDAAETWRWMARHALGNDRQATQYAGQLIAEAKFAQAEEAWWVYSANRTAASDANILRNGGFEDEPDGAAFNWLLIPFDQAPAKRDCRVAHSGQCSLSIHFDARENIVYAHASETIVINPGRYQFHAYMRSEDITTDEGVRFRIRDVEHPARFNLLTESIRGSSDWVRLEQPFRVPVETRVVSVEVYRAASHRFENRIKGTVWIDDVAIVPDGAAGDGERGSQ